MRCMFVTVIEYIKSRVTIGPYLSQGIAATVRHMYFSERGSIWVLQQKAMETQFG